MSLSDDLTFLRQQRAAQIHTLHLTYLRTKRTIIRKTSPSRLIRGNVAASLGIAASLGLLIAPRTGTPAPPPLPTSSETPPPAVHPASEKPAHKHSLLRTLLLEAATFLLSQIDLKKIIALALETFTHSMNQTHPDQPNEPSHTTAPISNPETLSTNTLDDFQ